LRIEDFKEGKKNIEVSEAVPISNSVDTEKMEINGIAIMLGMKSRNGYYYEKGCFEKGTINVPALSIHDDREVIGNSDVTFNNDIGSFTMRLNPEIEIARKRWENVKHGDIKFVSIGAMINEYHFDDDDILRITKAELLELSLVPIPGMKDAKILDFQGLNINEIKESELKKMDFKDMALSELNEKIKSQKLEISKNEEELMGVKQVIEACEDDKTIEDLVEEKSTKEKNIVEAKETLVEMQAVQVIRENRLQELKKKAGKSNMIANKEETTLTSNDNNINGAEVFAKSDKATSLFRDAVAEAVRNGKKSTDVYREKVISEGFSGDWADLMPTSVASTIQDMIVNVGTLMPFVNHISGVTDWSAMINQGDEYGYGHNAQIDKNKEEQQNNLTSIKIFSQYVYKYVVVDREQLDQPNNVLYNYIIAELSRALTNTIERAIVVGDGIPEGDKKHITTIKPMRSTDVLRKTDYANVGNKLTPDLLDNADASLIDDSTLQTVFVMSKKTFSNLKTLRNAVTGTKEYDHSTVSINGRNYDTLNGYVIVIKSFMTDWDASFLVGGDCFILGFKANSYDLITYKPMAEMFANFKLSTNENEFLTETRAGGDVVKPKSVVAILKDGVPELASKSKK
jgi:HK97 family phage major capsid protein/HK97 family phage prohead protease